MSSPTKLNEVAATGTIEFSYFSWVQAVLAVLSACGAATGAVLLAQQESAVYVAVVICGASMAILMTLVAIRRRGKLSLGQTLCYRRGRLRIDLPLESIEAVRVTRPTWPLQRPTDFAVRVRVESRTFSLSFAEYWLSGRSAMANARRVADLAEVAIEDPKGERWRRWNLAPLRWRADGDDWKIVLLTLLLASALSLTVIV